jgi:hypothetical protein
MRLLSVLSSILAFAGIAAVSAKAADGIQGPVIGIDLGTTYR